VIGSTGVVFGLGLDRDVVEVGLELVDDFAAALCMNLRLSVPEESDILVESTIRAMEGQPNEKRVQYEYCSRRNV